MPENDSQPSKGVLVEHKIDRFDLYFLDSQNLDGPKFSHNLGGQAGAYFQPSMLPNTTTQTNRVYYLNSINYGTFTTSIRHGNLSDVNSGGSLTIYSPYSFLAAGAVQYDHPSSGKFHNAYVYVDNGTNLTLGYIFSSHTNVDSPMFTPSTFYFISPQDILSKNYQVGRNTVFFLEIESGKIYFVLSFEKDNFFDNYLYEYDTTNIKMIKRKEYSFKGRIESTINNATQILVRNAHYYEVYNSDGGLVCRFPAGKLHFVHERYDSSKSKWFSVFSITLYDKNTQRLKIQAYEYPSDQLSELSF